MSETNKEVEIKGEKITLLQVRSNVAEDLKYCTVLYTGLHTA